MADIDSHVADRLRNYQEEMLDASMKENIIVAVCLLIQFTLNELMSPDGYRKRQDACVRFSHEPLNQ